MSTLRFHAIKETFNRPVIDVQEPQRRSDIFGSNVFNNAAMRQFLTKDSFKSVQDAVVNGSKINRAIADHISTGMKVGYRKRSYSLHALVSAIDRNYCRET